WPPLPRRRSPYAGGETELESSPIARHTGVGGSARSVGVWYRVGAARPACREGQGRARVFDKPAMTHKLPRYLLVVTVASVAAISCREQSVAVVPPLIPLQKSSLVGGPSASVAKPLDAASSDSRREEIGRASCRERAETAAWGVS